MRANLCSCFPLFAGEDNQSNEHKQGATREARGDTLKKQGAMEYQLDTLSDQSICIFRLGSLVANKLL